MMQQKSTDHETANRFASSWNNLPQGSVYTAAQFEEWMYPLTKEYVENKRVLELGCGNASLMVHMASWKPRYLEGVDLGDSVLSAYKNMSHYVDQKYAIYQTDLTEYISKGFDVVYCIGVLHHLKDPFKGFQSVVRNVSAGGAFHCWVYAQEGNATIRMFVDPVRMIASRLPWFISKYCLALPLVIPFFIYAHIVSRFKNNPIVKKLPLFEYAVWIVQREFSFFHHVAFDQLVTPQTRYIPKAAIEKWLGSIAAIDLKSTYIIKRNGNSWKFGGRVY